MFKEQIAISDCLDKLGYKKMPLDVLRETDAQTLITYVKLIEKKARASNQLYLLERLEFAGLIYLGRPSHAK